MNKRQSIEAGTLQNTNIPYAPQNAKIPGATNDTIATPHHKKKQNARKPNTKQKDMGAYLKKETQSGNKRYMQKANRCKFEEEEGKEPT